MTHIIPVGTSEPQDFQFRNAIAGGAATAIVGTGLTVTLQIHDARTGVAVASPPSVAWLDQAAGTVRVTGTGTLALGSYLVRYKLTDAGTLVGFAPNGAQADIWRVVKVPGI